MSSGRPAAALASWRRRLERSVVGLGMGIAAFVLERVVIRSIKRRGSNT